MKLRSALLLTGVVTAALTLNAIAVAPLGKGPLTELGAGFSGLRGIKEAVLRHFLNFRKETPLSAEQKQKVGDILKSHRKEIRAQFEKGRAARHAMQAAVKQGGADTPATQEAAKQIGEASRERALLSALITREVRPLLTEAQKTRIEAARAEIEALVDEAMTKTAP